MLRARLWYGPAGHGIGLDRVASYLAGPLACRAQLRMVQRFGQSHEQVVLHEPIHTMIEIDRRPEVRAEAADLVDRLPSAAPPGLAGKLAGCTARLDLCDGPEGVRLVPATATSRSVLVPLAFAMDGIIEEVASGRLLFFTLPTPPKRSVVDTALTGLVAGLGIALSWLALRPGPSGRVALPGARFWPEASRLPPPAPSPRRYRPATPLALPAPPRSR
ncbi:hypothetical protein EV662_10336 [Rhodovulum marinum]|uniref:Uncharacterized protein n=1 Tax=Rhodovulum marinum TaxID=320662 RepID=A0A4R2Q5W0_9RHOB|nr:hypothetical protein EV662_10336 [Rhodovulum marinum]